MGSIRIMAQSWKDSKTEIVITIESLEEDNRVGSLARNNLELSRRRIEAFEEQQVLDTLREMRTDMQLRSELLYLIRYRKEQVSEVYRSYARTIPMHEAFDRAMDIVAYRLEEITRNI